MISHFLKVLQECLLFPAQNAEILQNLKKNQNNICEFATFIVYISCMNTI